MTGPQDPGAAPGDGRPPSGRRPVAEMLEWWKDRALGVLEESAVAARDDAAIHLERLRVFAFFKRTDPNLLDSKAWHDLRARIEGAVEARCGEPALRDATLAALGRIEERFVRELAEHLAHASYLDGSAGTGKRPPRRRDAVGADEDADEGADDSRIAALRLLEELDGLLLGTSGYFVAYSDLGRIGPGSPDVVRARRLRAIALQAARSGEAFASLDRWIAALERTMHRFYAMAAGTEEALKPGVSLVDVVAPSDQLLIASAEWTTIARARIRLRRLETQDERAERRGSRARSAVLARLETIDREATANPDRWMLVGGSSEGDGSPVLANAAAFGPIASLVRRLANELRPLRAAARETDLVRTNTTLDWMEPDGGAMARCLFDESPDSRATSTPEVAPSSLVLRFFDQVGERTGSFDGQSASWLGVTTTIVEGRASFPTAALRSTASPASVLRNAGGLFVGGTAWLPIFGDLA